MTKLRTIKHPDEIREMRAGIQIARKGFLKMMEEARPGMTEYQLKALWDYTVSYEGVKEMAFQPIITTGINNFCIHYSDYTATIKKLDLGLKTIV